MKLNNRSKARKFITLNTNSESRANGKTTKTKKKITHTLKINLKGKLCSDINVKPQKKTIVKNPLLSLQ